MAIIPYSHPSIYSHTQALPPVAAAAAAAIGARKKDHRISDLSLSGRCERAAIHAALARKNYQLMSNLFSPADKVIIQLAYDNGINYNLIKGGTGKQKIITQCFQIAYQLLQMVKAQMEKVNSDLTCAFGQMTIEEQTNSPDLEEKHHQIIRNISHEVNQQFGTLAATAHVASLNALQTKANQINSLKQQAAKLFFRIPENIELMIAADAVMIIAATEMLSNSHLTIIREYWLLIAQDPHGYQLHNNCEEQFANLFSEIALNHAEKMLRAEHRFAREHSSLSPGDAKAAVAEFFVKELNALLQTKKEELFKERSQLMPGKKQIMMDYLLLQGALKGQTLINMIIRQRIEAMTKEHEDYITLILNGSLKIHVERAIHRFEEKLKDNSFEHSIEAAREHNLEVLIKEFEEQEKKSREDSEKRLAIWVARKHNLRDYAHALFGNPNKIRQYIPVQTWYEHSLSQCLRLRPQAFTSPLSFISPEIVMEISKLSVAYFLQQMKEEAQRKFHYFTIRQ